MYSFFILNMAVGQDAAVPVGGSSPMNFYSLSLDRLDLFSQWNLKSLKGKKSLWVLFQPDCQSCEAQFNDLFCIDSTVEKIAVGFWGTRENLNKVIRSSKFKGQKLIASAELEKRAPLKLTPTILIVDTNGSLKETVYAKTDCIKLKEKLRNI